MKKKLSELLNDYVKSKEALIENVRARTSIKESWDFLKGTELEGLELPNPVHLDNDYVINHLNETNPGIDISFRPLNTRQPINYEY